MAGTRVMPNKDTVDMDAMVGLLFHAHAKVCELQGLPSGLTRFWQYAELRCQANLLANELVALHKANDRERDAYRHKVRQHTARIQAFLRELRSLEAEPVDA
jgi:hypothetical protein